MNSTNSGSLSDKFLDVDIGSFDSDVDEFGYMNKRMEDISDVEVRKGNDIEGIPWERATITRNGKAISPLCTHVNNSFASAWHPDGLTFSTGNQDKMCSIWDIWCLSKSVTIFKGNLGAIQSICYTSDGRFMGMADLV
ncbi:hypothetical protein RDI58_001490 [Solanum bulbocastanum]|uniref:Uncharacterized protein n=1 Tax=Solanum bulbocastanum TaxID=147425 RepID=A0AAN8UEG1_SOLBU